VAAGVRDAYRALRWSLAADQQACGRNRTCNRRATGRAVITSPALQEYFREAASWDADRSLRDRRSAVVAWWVAGAGWVCAIAGAAAIVILMPLKQVEPFVVRVDNSTGIVDVVPVYRGGAALEESVTRYFLSH
jgi:type IV secretion system protein VirB8